LEPLKAARPKVLPHKIPPLPSVRQAIRELRLELQLILNKGALMILPCGVDKGTGLAAALKELDVRPEAVVGVGDAENDHAFLQSCGCAVAVSNALPAVRQRADLVTNLPDGGGVSWLIDRILGDTADYPLKPKASGVETE
jgi:hydroxymethylpyrimidine pyrophosphatase-like HAD family hydrolase